MNHVTIECRLEPVLRGPKAGQGRASIYMSGHGPKYFKEVRFKVVAPIEDLPTAVFAWMVGHVHRIHPIADLCRGDDWDTHFVMHSRLPKQVPVADPTKLMSVPGPLEQALWQSIAHGKGTVPLRERAPRKGTRPLGKKFPLR